ncbi:hypothetical protein QTP86_032027, partial [Hemibagrus guttatus]
DIGEYKKARYNLCKSIRKDKRDYSLRLEGYYTTADSRRMWQGLQHTTEYRQRSQGDITPKITLPDELNEFYARFKAPNTGQQHKTLASENILDTPLTMSSAEVHMALRKTNPWKAAGPDNIPGRALMVCLLELANVFTDIYNLSLTQALVPTCFKSTTIIPLPTKNTVTCLNDYHPIALTPIAMKYFERIVMSHMKRNIPTTGAERPDGQTPVSQSRKPDIRHQNCEHRHPQGCVLSPLLYTLFTYDCVASQTNTKIIKFADDTTVIGLVTGGEETSYRTEVAGRSTKFTLKAKKTKWLMVELWKSENSKCYPIHIKEIESELMEEQMKFQQRIQEKQKKVQELKQTVNTIKLSAQTAVEDNEIIFTELISSMEKKRSEVTELIRAQEKTELSRAERLLEQLEQEIADLQSRVTELEKISHTQDHIHFLQALASGRQSPELIRPDFDTSSITVPQHLSFDGVRNSLSDLKKRLEEFCEEEFNKIPPHGKRSCSCWRNTMMDVFTPAAVHIISPPEPQSREDFLKSFCYLTLDTNTAHHFLSLCEKKKAVARSMIVQQYCDHPERFDSCLQVLCKESVCGRCYWEVEWNNVVEVSVAYKGINRKGCELEEKERFWSELDEVMESIPMGERVVIGADFNGHVGEGNRGDEEVMGKFGVKERNLEGQMVVDFAKRMDVAVVNTYFQKREHRVTYKSGGRRTQVDYILCRRDCSDCKVVVGESVARQHRMVVCRMTFCKKKRSKIEKKKTKWWKLKKEECCEEFRQKLRQALGGQVVLPDDWETTAEVIRETGRKVLGVSSGRRKEDKETWWWNEEVQESIQRKRLDTREGQKDLYRLARQRDRDWKDAQQVRVIKDRDGRVLTSEENVQRRWKEYFEELMNEENEREKRVEGVNSVEQKVDKIRKDEVRKALKRMKSGKAVGPDDILVEVWKCLGVEFLTSLFNRVLESERMPEEWRSVLVPINKNKGDVQSCSNYRGIKLMSHTMKLWERVVEARLRKVVEVCEQQYGFMPRKSTTDAIFALRILMEKYRDGQRELHCVFVDLEKVYDRVPREEMWYCMRKSGVAEKYVRVVQDMYERSRTVVRCAVGQTEEFKVEVGLHQGSALSPFLFAMLMDQLSEKVRQESPWTMMFADDIVICSESREQVEKNLERWRFELERRGMKVSRTCEFRKMAEASISVDQDQFICPLCLDLLKDPVTIPCGHSFCKVCINGCWDQEDQKGVYSCPKCRDTFTPRPVLRRNNILAEVVEKLKKTEVQAASPAHCYAGPGDVECDFCTGRKHKAVKSCLVCVASFCETHLKPHLEIPALKKHAVVEASTNLQEKICSEHDKLMEIYCRTDQTCICYICIMDKHKGHNTVTASAERAEKQSQLQEKQVKFQQRLQEKQKKVQELKQSVNTIKLSAQTAVDDNERIFTELISFMEKKRSEVTELIRAQEKTELSRAERLLEQLEQEIADLQRRVTKLEQLSHTHNHVHFLQSELTEEQIKFQQRIQEKQKKVQELKQTVNTIKKGDRRVCSNYRGITLLSLPGKVYSRVLERRVRPLVEPRIQEEQCGFRPSRGTLDQLYTLHRVLEGSWEFAQPVHMCFVDLEKAFDRVPRGILWEVLWEYGVRGPLLRDARSLYNWSRSLVRIASCLDLQHALGRFAAECEAAGMRVSTSKSEAVVLDRKKVACTLQVGGEVLPQVEEFKYLGVLFTSEGRMDREIDRRIGAAAAVMRSMYRSVVVKKELSRKAKLSIYQSIYVPTLTYGHELWVMTERVRSRIQAAEMSFLCSVAGRSLRDRVRSSVTWEELGVEPLLLHIERGQLRWLGHLFRMPPGCLPGEVFRACPTGKRPRGRPRTRWRDYVFRLAWECLGVPPEELKEVARERESELKEEQIKFQHRIQEKQKKVQELKQTVNTIKLSAQIAVEDNEIIFTELISSMKKKRSEVTELIRAQEKAELSRAERLLEQLEQEIADLQRRLTELEQLSHTHDHVQFIQVTLTALASGHRSSLLNRPDFDTSSITVPQHLSFDGVRNSLSDLKKRLEEFCEIQQNPST